MKKLFIFTFFFLIILNLYASANVFSLSLSTSSSQLSEKFETDRIKSYVEVLNKNTEMERLEMLLKLIGVAKLVRITLKRTMYLLGTSKARTVLKYTGYLRKEKNKEIVDLLLPLVKEKSLDVRMNTFNAMLAKQNPNFAHEKKSHNQFSIGNVEHPHDFVVGVAMGL